MRLRRLKQPIGVDQVEADLVELHAKWLEIEGEFRTRDTTIEALERELLERQSSNTDLTSKVDHLSQQRSELEEELKLNNEVSDRYRDEIAAKEFEIESLHQQSTDLQSQVDQLQQQCSMHEEHQRQLHAEDTVRGRQLLGLKEALKQQRFLAAERQRHIDLKSSAWSANEAAIAAAKSRIAELKSIILNQQKLNKRQNRETRELQQELDTLRKRVSTLKETMGNQAASNTELVENLALHRVRHADREMELQQQKSIVEQRNMEIVELADSLQRALTEADKQAKKMATLEKARGEMRGHLSEKLEKLAAADNDIQATRLLVSEQESELGEVHSELESERAISRKLQKEVARLQPDLENQSLTIDQLTAKNKELNGQCSRTADTLEDTKLRLGDQKKKANKQHREAQQLGKELEKSESQIEDLRNEVISYEERWENIEAELVERTEHIQQLTGEVAAKSTTISELTESELGAVQKAKSLEAQQAEFNTTANSVRQDLDELRKNTNKLRTALARKETETAELKDDLSQKSTLIELLERKITRLSSIEESLEDLDARMAKKIDSPLPEQGINRLLISTNGENVVKYPLYKEALTIGRTPENDIQVRTQFVSRHHANVISDDRGAIIEDLGSKNGVLVNSRRVRRKRLQNGDLVDIGKMQFKFIDLMDENSGEGHA